jgi:hypothetical protein
MHYERDLGPLPIWRSFFILALAKSLPLGASIVKVHEAIWVQACSSQVSAERLERRIIVRLPGPQEIERHATHIGQAFLAASDELNALVH